MESTYKLCFYGGLILAAMLFITAIILFFALKIPKVVGELTGRTAKKYIENNKNKVMTSSEAARQESAKYYNVGTGKIKVRKADENQDGKPKGRDTENLKRNRSMTTSELRDEEATEVLSKAAVDDSGEATEVLQTRSFNNDAETEVLSNDSDAETDVLVSEADDAETDVLVSEADDAETDVLISEADDAETDVLISEADDAETDVLISESDDATDILTAYTEDEDATTILSGVHKTKDADRKFRVCYNIVVTHTNETL